MDGIKILLDLRRTYRQETGKKVAGLRGVYTVEYTQWLQKQLVNKLLIQGVRLMLPDNEELNSLKNQYPASGGDAGWIQDAYKNGYIDGWNRKRTDKHLRKSIKNHKPKGN